VISAILLIVIAAVIVVPSVSTATLAVEVTGAPVGELGRVIIDIESIEMHRWGARENAGWLILSEEITLDLSQDAPARTIGLERELPLGRYDKISVIIGNVTLLSEGGPVVAGIPQNRMDAEIQLQLDFGANANLRVSIDYVEEALVAEQVFKGSLTVSTSVQ